MFRKFKIIKTRGWTKIFIVNLLACVSFSLYAETKGKLIFLGKTNDLSHSVWVSATTAGSFELQNQGQQVVDEWSLSVRGLHLSLSPFVSQGNGGTHHLINQETGKKLDSQNQKGDFVFPPFPELPDITPPVTILPLGRLMPAEFKSSQINPPSPTLKEDTLFTLNSCWNVWSNNRYYGIQDNRFELNSNGYAGNYTIGADKFINEDLVSGMMMSFSNYKISAFNNALRNRASGFLVGPYFGYRLSSKWVTDGSFSVGAWSLYDVHSICFTECNWILSIWQNDD